MISVEIRLNTRRLEQRLNGINKNLGMQLDVAVHNFAIIARDGIKRQFILQTKRQSRVNTANKFDTKKLRRFQYAVTVPFSAYNLDSMAPHYEQLTPGKKVTEWAMNNFDGRKKTGRSHVYRGITGRILYNSRMRSELYVTPDPFIRKGYDKIKNRLQQEIRSAIRRSFEQVV
jgi:hypothetical protein